MIFYPSRLTEAFSNTGFPDFLGLITGFSEIIVIAGFPESPSPPPLLGHMIQDHISISKSYSNQMVKNSVDNRHCALAAK